MKSRDSLFFITRRFAESLLTSQFEIHVEMLEKEKYSGQRGQEETVAQ